ncbi:unnamed protein product, partial [Mesorhabditis spiculigera]
ANSQLKLDFQTTDTQRRTLEDQLDVTRRREAGVTEQAANAEKEVRRLSEELREAQKAVTQYKQDMRKIELNQTNASERLKEEKKTYLNNLQQEWNGLKSRLEKEHGAEMAALRGQSERLQTELDDMQHELRAALHKIRELEHGRMAFEQRTSEDLQRRMMVKYRDLVQDLAPRREVSPPTIPPSYRAPFDQENAGPSDQPPEKMGRKEALTSVITKALQNRQKRH